MTGLDSLRTEVERLVARVPTEAGRWVPVRPGDRVRFFYRGRPRIGIIVGVRPGGLLLKEDGVAEVKSYLVERIAEFEFVATEHPAVCPEVPTAAWSRARPFE